MAKFRKEGGKETPCNFNSVSTGHRVHAIILLHG